jgi:hypothetical protein
MPEHFISPDLFVIRKKRQKKYAGVDRMHPIMAAACGNSIFEQGGGYTRESSLQAVLSYLINK